jgi:hypothetical protein
LANVIDEEEFKIIDEMKQLKNLYKENVDKFKYSKTEISIMKNNLDVLKVKYVDTFEGWFYKKYGVRIEEHELKLEKVILEIILA